MILMAGWAGATASVGATPEREKAPSPEGVEFFETHVRPVLVDHCYGCHSASAEKVRGDFVVDTKAGWERGGASGKPSVLPGNPGGSPLIRAIRHEDPDLAMPPKKKLSANRSGVGGLGHGWGRRIRERASPCRTRGRWPNVTGRFSR
jgi:hypothetical protein